MQEIINILTIPKYIVKKYSKAENTTAVGKTLLKRNMCVHNAAYISSIASNYISGKLIGFPVWGQLCCSCQGEEWLEIF